ncbi:MAG: hypothetical protein WA741_23755 [Candidatus Sulfotelmatobacter sp.]
MTKLPLYEIPGESSGDGPDGEFRRGPGRPTIEDDTLCGHRDELVWLLSAMWGYCGWQIQNATTVDELRQAFEPLRGHPSGRLVAPFLHATSITSNSGEIRSLKRSQGEAVGSARGAQETCDACSEIARRVELALNQAGPIPPPILQAELIKAWTGTSKARNELAAAQAALKAIERDLAEKSASFAQSELLDYITKKKYARDPLGLADAMAGLPDMGWETSHDRCSKFNYDQWPTFEYRVCEEFRAIWNRRESNPELSVVQLFRQEIEKLPKQVMVDYPHLQKKIKQDNILRTHLGERAWHLRLAIEQADLISADSSRVPFLILSAFRNLLEKPQTAQDLIHAARETIK